MINDQTKAERVQRALSAAIHEAFDDEEGNVEVLLNKWVFVSDLIIDGERMIMTVWDESIHPLEAESLLRPALRLSEKMADSFSVGLSSEYLGSFDINADDDDFDMDEDD